MGGETTCEESEIELDGLTLILLLRLDRVVRLVHQACFGVYGIEALLLLLLLRLGELGDEGPISGDLRIEERGGCVESAPPSLAVFKKATRPSHSRPHHTP